MNTKKFRAAKSIGRHLLRYGPLLLLLVLVVAWMVSCFGTVRVLARTSSDRQLLIDLARGYVGGTLAQPPSSWRIHWDAHPLPPAIVDVMGTYHYSSSRRQTTLVVPIAWLLTLLLPISIGALTRFRFRLWQWLAYMGLAAIELAYYLQWAERI